VFYISTISERYMGSKLSFIKGAVRAFPFAFLSIFHKSKSSSLIYLIRKASSEA